MLVNKMLCMYSKDETAFCHTLVSVLRIVQFDQIEMKLVCSHHFDVKAVTMGSSRKKLCKKYSKRGYIFHSET